MALEALEQDPDLTDFGVFDTIGIEISKSATLEAPDTNDHDLPESTRFKLYRLVSCQSSQHSVIQDDLLVA
ncbi:hypothetical protein RRG08_042902 [Elysia crispata]|uniref:Uncharacterized protein n=1 Tax=Elysia crispata TaxID=231223 RepID=A0AAE1AUF7_9GAST|nr:hypothetical protein RRG08_042902 [Elysia crispata]